MNAVAPRPIDVRLMNMTFVVLLLTFAGLGAVSGVRWLARLSVFDIQAITVLGDTRHSNNQKSLAKSCFDRY